MSETLDKFLRTTKKLYQRIQNEMLGNMQGIDSFLFPESDFDTAANFSLDRLIKNPHGVAFRRSDEQSAVRPFENGTGYIYEVPRTSEKTPISELLRDSVVAALRVQAVLIQLIQKCCLIFLLSMLRRIILRVGNMPLIQLGRGNFLHWD